MKWAWQKQSKSYLFGNSHSVEWLTNEMQVRAGQSHLSIWRKSVRFSTVYQTPQVLNMESSDKEMRFLSTHICLLFQSRFPQCRNLFGNTNISRKSSNVAKPLLVTTHFKMTSAFLWNTVNISIKKNFLFFFVKLSFLFVTFQKSHLKIMRGCDLLHSSNIWHLSLHMASSIGLFATVRLKITWNS